MKQSSSLVTLSLFVLFASAAVCSEEPTDWRDAFAERLYNAWRAGEPMPRLGAVHPDADLADAYAIQTAFVSKKLKDDAIGGYKAAGVGGLGEDLPLVAVIPASGVLHARDSVVIALSDDPHRHVENEIGYVFGVSVNAPLDDVDDLRERVSAVVAIVEVPGNAVDDSGKVTQEDLVAWNINGKEMIVGERHAPMEVDLDALEITFTRDGEVINTARGDMAVAGQWPTLLKTVNNLILHGYVIEPGHIITNGALNKILKAEPGEYCANYGSLGEIRFEIR